jgi:hypothetical protein
MLFLFQLLQTKIVGKGVDKMEIGEVLWIEYDYLTESHDRSLPHAMSKYGGAIVRPDCHKYSLAYSNMLRGIMRNQFRVYGNAANEFFKNMSFEKISELYHSMDYHPLTDALNERRYFNDK